VLPIGRGPGQKSPPPGNKASGVTWTGHGAPYPGSADIAAWIDGPESAYNVGLRAPEGVIGLDVDHYGKKNGADVLAELASRFGPLPDTWVSSARPAPSGIRWYRVPTEIDGRPINWPGEAGKYIEIIQSGHRYGVVWPSTNPEADGAEYGWRHPDQGFSDVIPKPVELAWLPEAWVRGLMLDYARTDKAELADTALGGWWALLRGGEPCPVVHRVTVKALETLKDEDGSRHESARDAAAAITRLGGEGHRGVPQALHALAEGFAAAVGPDRVANGEWQRLLSGAVKLAAASNPDPRQACEHDPLPAWTGPPGFDLAASIVEARQRAEVERREQQAAAAAIYQQRADVMRAEVDALPFEQRAEAVRRLIPEIATWAPAEQGYARDHLSSKHGLTDLGVTEFNKLLRAEEKARKAAADEAALEAARQIAAEQVERARTEGTLLPPPHAPIDVARALAGRMTVPARWWRGDFYQWDGTRYREWRGEAVDNWLYTQTADAWFEGAGEDEGTKPWRPSETKIAGVSHALSRGVLYRASEEEPDDSPSQVACANGVYDVAAGELLPHTPERFNMQAVPFAYDPQAKAPTWEWFLNDVLPADAQLFLQEWFGYVLSGRTDLEKIANLVGRRRSGKGTISTVLDALVGEENCAAPSLPSLVGTFGEQPLLGKTLATFSDISWSFRDVAEAVEIIKKISGNDARDVNRKNRDVWHGKLGVRFMIMGNDMPRFTDASGALAGRMIHVQFPGSFFGRERPTVKADLMAELPGILNWALAGLARLDAAGRFTVPQTSEELAAEVRRQQSPVQAFLDDTCAQSDEAPPVPLDELYPVYKAWAKDAGVEHPLNREHLSRALGSAGLPVRRERVNGVRARRVYGIVPTLDEDGRSAWVGLLNPHALPPVVPPEGWSSAP
jgi:putative DNA primase/helicase